MARLTARGLPAAQAAQIAAHHAAASRHTPASDHPQESSAARGVARAARRLDVLTVRDALTASVT